MHKAENRRKLDEVITPSRLRSPRSVARSGLSKKRHRSRCRIGVGLVISTLFEKYSTASDRCPKCWRNRWPDRPPGRSSECCPYCWSQADDTPLVGTFESTRHSTYHQENALPADYRGRNVASTALGVSQQISPFSERIVGLTWPPCCHLTARGQNATYRPADMRRGELTEMTQLGIAEISLFKFRALFGTSERKQVSAG